MSTKEEQDKLASETCFMCGSERSRITRSILYRLGHEPTLEELWKRLERAEADRDRMLNALQLVRDRHYQKAFLPPHTMALVNRALSRVQPVRALAESRS